MRINFTEVNSGGVPNTNMKMTIGFPRARKRDDDDDDDGDDDAERRRRRRARRFC